MSPVYYISPIISNISFCHKKIIFRSAVKCLEICYCKSLHSNQFLNIFALFGPSIANIDCQSAKTSSSSPAECVKSFITTAVCYFKFVQFTSQKQTTSQEVLVDEPSDWLMSLTTEAIPMCSDLPTSGSTKFI